MSREILGFADTCARVLIGAPSTTSLLGSTPDWSTPADEPVRAATLELTDAAAAEVDHIDGVAPAATRGTTYRRPLVGVALATLFAIGVALGATEAGSWATEPTTTGVVTALITEVGLRSPPRDNTPGLGTMSVLLRNERDTPVTVRPPITADQWGFAVRVSSMTPTVLPARAERTAVVEVALLCDRALAFGVAPLRISAAERGEHLVPLLAGQAEATRLCGLLDQPSLMIARAEQTDHRLQVFLEVPTGRSERIIEVSAGGVAVPTTPLPVTIAGPATSLWLSPPAECAATWRSDQIPTTLDISTRNGATDLTAEITVEVGPALAQWLLVEVCS